MAELDGLLGYGEGGLLVEPPEAAVAQDGPLDLELFPFPRQHVDGARVVP